MFKLEPENPLFALGVGSDVDSALYRFTIWTGGGCETRGETVLGEERIADCRQVWRGGGRVFGTRLAGGNGNLVVFDDLVGGFPAV